MLKLNVTSSRWRPRACSRFRSKNARTSKPKSPSWSSSVGGLPRKLESLLKPQRRIANKGSASPQHLARLLEIGPDLVPAREPVDRRIRRRAMQVRKRMPLLLKRKPSLARTLIPDHPKHPNHRNPNNQQYLKSQHPQVRQDQHRQQRRRRRRRHLPKHLHPCQPV
jgi:hypothetical protein